MISTYTNDGSKAVTIASTTSNDGGISIYNRHNKKVVTLQGNVDADGTIILYDRYGDAGWAQSGKK